MWSVSAVGMLRGAGQTDKLLGGDEIQKRFRLHPVAVTRARCFNAASLQ